MLKCWQHYPENQPNFAELRKELDVMLTNHQQEEYIEINAVDEPYCAMYPAQDDPDDEETTVPQVHTVLLKCNVTHAHQLHVCSWHIVFNHTCVPSYQLSLRVSANNSLTCTYFLSFWCHMLTLTYYSLLHNY